MPVVIGNKFHIKLFITKYMCVNCHAFVGNIYILKYARLYINSDNF